MPPTAAATTGSARRPTKAERGAATRARLLDATIDCLVELGWSGTSTTEVVRRAGLTRGAQVHHFPTKEDLVLAAVEHLCDRRQADFRRAFHDLPPDERTPDAALDLLREAHSGPAFTAWLELAVAARTQPNLHERFVAADRRFWDASLAITREVLAGSSGDPALAPLALRLAFAVVNGLAVSRLGGAEWAELDEAAEAFRQLAASALPATEESP